MGEDKTKILGDEGQSEDLVAQKAATTNPMLEAILARMNQGFAELDKKFNEGFAELDKKFNEGFAELDKKFNEGFAELNTKVVELDKKFNEGFAELNTKVAQLNTKVDALTVEIREIKGHQRVFNDQMLRVQSLLIDHDERLLNLERKAS